MNKSDNNFSQKIFILLLNSANNDEEEYPSISCYKLRLKMIYENVFI